MPPPTVRVRLLLALGLMFGLMLGVSLIAFRVLTRSEDWMNHLHQETLSEVSEALEISRHSAELATSAPFLASLFLPFQLEKEAQTVLDTLSGLEALTAGHAALDLPLQRLRLAIDDLTTALGPQAGRAEAIAAIDRDMARLDRRLRRLAADRSAPLARRQGWQALQQLTASAIGAARADALIELGEFGRDFTTARAGLAQTLPEALRPTLDEIDTALIRGAPLFVLKHQQLASALDAENALFRIRQETSRITAYAADNVAQAQARLSLARAQTSADMGIAMQAFGALTLASLLIAVLSALYVSRYVARNLRRIADAMRRLASGDHRARVPSARLASDEIGQLFAAFEVFRENARKLDRRTGEIRRQNALFSRVFRNIKDGVAITSASGRIEAENANLRALLRLPPRSEDPGAASGMAELIRRSAFARQSPAQDRGGFEEYRDGSDHVLELRHSPLPDGGTVWLLSETTERKRVEHRLEEIRRVETLGKVTGEVAHDFGNILSSISGNLHLLAHATGPEAERLRLRIGSAVDLGVSLTERLLAFARKQHLHPQITDLGQLAEGMADLLEIALPEGVTLTFDLPQPPVRARVDPGQLESALLNLCVNAGQAITGKGTIRIAAAPTAEGGALLSVRDDGCGMSPEVLRHATEPFFTQRSDGSGTGLGLSMVDGFVHQSGGSLRITSTPGQGTCVTLLFPPVRAADPLPAAPSMTARLALVVDDDATARDQARTHLRALGYRVETAPSFAAGSARLATGPAPDLLLSDLHLDDGAMGWALLAQAARQHPGCGLIAMSTRAIPAPPEETGPLPALARLTKPLDPEALRQAIALAAPGQLSGQLSGAASG